MAFPSGFKFGPYEILAPLGSGGMGEVYRAKDTRLGRDVAVKVLPHDMSADPARKQRFEREAQAISALNHPHICVLHDVGSQDGVDFLVMELMDGEPLSKRLEKGPLPLDQVVKFGSQIADGLDKAHRAGIVHRDLKPANIMLTPSGAKLLDFGLAKPAAASASLATLTALSPASAPVTEAGMVVGTFQYMSPEQVEGKDVDARSDIFSLGAVLYEMVTGKRAFEGKSQLSVASSIIEKDPQPISSIRPLWPRAIDHVIAKCLAKDPARRWQCAADISSELHWAAENSSSLLPPAAAPPKKLFSFLPWLLSALLAVGLAIALFGARSSHPTDQPEYYSAPFHFAVNSMAIAPNGHTVAIATEGDTEKRVQLWLYEIGSREIRALPDTDGASFPFWSPDGKSLGFFAGGKLKKLDLAGGPALTLCDAPSGRGGTWNTDGVILFTPSGRLGDVLYRISAAGGTATPITTLNLERRETSHRWPQFLPDGKHFLFMTFSVSGQTSADAIFVGSLDSKETKKITDATSNATYVSPGFLVFARGRSLFAQKFDLSSLSLQGVPVAIFSEVRITLGIGYSVFATSSAETLLSQTGASVALSRLVWFDRSGKELGQVGGPEEFVNVALSPDGKSVAVNKTDQTNQNIDIWIYALQGNRLRRLTFDPAINSQPIWSPDGSHIVFSSSRKQAFDLYLKPSDGSQDEKDIESTTLDKYPQDWSRDGKYILYIRDTELWTLSYPDLVSKPFLTGPSAHRGGQFSPDGKWVAYASNETGKWEVYVTSFPDAKGKWQVSNTGGLQPRWRGDGRELFYFSPDGKLMAVPINTISGFDPGAPVALFQADQKDFVSTSDQILYDVTRDGQKFLINTKIRNGASQPMSVLLHWSSLLKK